MWSAPLFTATAVTRPLPSRPRGFHQTEGACDPGSIRRKPSPQEMDRPRHGPRHQQSGSEAQGEARGCKKASVTPGDPEATLQTPRAPSGQKASCPESVRRHGLGRVHPRRTEPSFEENAGRHFLGKSTQAAGPAGRSPSAPTRHLPRRVPCRRGSRDIH